MQAVILAGGLGTRLRPAVHDLPKAMAPVLGKPFLEYQLTLLARHGIREIVLCLGHRAAAIQHHFGDGARWGLHIVYSVEPRPLGTGGALRFAAPLLTGRCLVLNGDTYAPREQRRSRGAGEQGRQGEGETIDSVVRKKEAVMRSLDNLKAITVEMKNALLQGRLDDFGALLHEAWLNKKGVDTHISNSQSPT